MSDKRDDGGPAFPLLPPICADGHPAAGYPYPSDGMTLRDYFAAYAMQAMLANPTIEILAPTGRTPAQETALAAYSIADAMLAERAK